MKPYERRQLLERVEREGATVGASIPDDVDLDGEPFPLREFVFEVKRRERVPEGDREEVEAVKKALRRERLARKQRLEEGDLTRETGERLVEEIVGLERALEGLADLGPTDLEAEIRASEVADRKRWRSFLETALGRDGDAGRSRP